MRFVYRVDGQERVVTLERVAEGFQVQLDGRPLDVQVETLAQGFVLRTGGTQHRAIVAAQGGTRRVHLDGQQYTFEVPPPHSRPPATSASDGSLRAQMPGVITALQVSLGDRVSAGQVVLVIEAMKMETRMVAPIEGVVHALPVQPGALVERGQLLVEIRP